MAYNTITVENIPTLIVGSNPKRLSLIIEVVGANTIYIGQDTSVTTANGIQLVQNAILTEDSGSMRMYCGDYYGITASGSSDIRYWERISNA